ncbi:DUF4422 domain-containing protein [Lacticaseibacillus hulanensis]|uniref:DUF4422 domain-containing protein n=1 Tax=Lacticaseibacillus hulanensis TaxID=2493111 RepID=UPI0019D4734C|nr:DUF4422 domain-containing protein [Lacticaseibacillus hulanensis]
MKSIILVATHKKAPVPSSNLYLPVVVGANKNAVELNRDFARDNSGMNISDKNPYYNELTAIYWAWKNLDDYDWIGLVHYRRYFIGTEYDHDLQTKILSSVDLEKYTSEFDIILPKPRNYFIESNYSHYVHAHHREPIEETKRIIQQYYPQLLDSFNNVLNNTKAHMFNMFIMKKSDFDRYCTFMFDVLSKLETRIDTAGYSTYELRVYGFISELFLDTWINNEHKKHPLKVLELPVKFTEHQNWVIKGAHFLKRKFMPEY